MVRHDVCHGAGAVHDVVYIHEQPQGPDLEGELLHVRGPGEPQIQVKGRRAFCLRIGAPGVSCGLCLVQALLSPTLGHLLAHLLRWPADGAGSCRCLGPTVRCILCARVLIRDLHVPSLCMIVPFGGSLVGGHQP